MPVQENELEEIDETLEINRRKIVTKQIQKPAASLENSIFDFEFEVVSPEERKEGESDFNRDRTEEERPSYIIKMRNRK
jgi:hypothetical protein